LTILFLFICPPRPPSAPYPLSLHDALPISRALVEPALRLRAAARSLLHRLFDHAAEEEPRRARARARQERTGVRQPGRASCAHEDRKSTRLNSSHVKISYAVFCLKKKNT